MAKQGFWDIKPGVHGHICVNPSCQWAWTHGNDSANNRADHTCPACGTLLGGGWLKAYPEEVTKKLATQPPTPPTDIPKLTVEQEREIYADDNDPLLALFSEFLSFRAKDDYSDDDYEGDYE